MRILHWHFSIMNFIEPLNRSQLTFSSLEDLVSSDNPVRFIDAFAEHLDLKRLGFEVKELKKEGDRKE